MRLLPDPAWKCCTTAIVCNSSHTKPCPCAIFVYIPGQLKSYWLVDRRSTLYRGWHILFSPFSFLLEHTQPPTQSEYVAVSPGTKQQQRVNYSILASSIQISWLTLNDVISLPSRYFPQLVYFLFDTKLKISNLKEGPLPVIRCSFQVS
jgi:hypothetical protein